MTKTSVHQLWRDTSVILVPFLWILAVVYNFLLGLAFLVGGEERISGPSFAIIRSYGGHVSMGVFFCLAALLLALSAGGRASLMAASFCFTGTIHLFIVASFLVGVFSEPVGAEPKIAWTGIPTYFAVAATHMALARLYWYCDRKVDGAT